MVRVFAAGQGQGFRSIDCIFSLHGEDLGVGQVVRWVIGYRKKCTWRFCKDLVNALIGWDAVDVSLRGVQAATKAMDAEPKRLCG